MKRIIIFLIDFYSRFISPLKGKRTCRFYPTCSSYARQAVLKHGVIKGSLMSMWRLLRCNPFNDGGYDPVK